MVPGIQRSKGKVLWYNVRRKFGFIRRTDSGEDVLVWQDALRTWNRNHRIPSLDEGEEVEFDLKKGTRRMLAINVTGPKGAQLRGSRFAPRRTIKRLSEQTKLTTTTLMNSPSQSSKQRESNMTTTIPELGSTDHLGQLPFQGEQLSSVNSSPLTPRGESQRTTFSPSSSASQNPHPSNSASTARSMEQQPACSSTQAQPTRSFTRRSSKKDD